MILFQTFLWLDDEQYMEQDMREVEYYDDTESGTANWKPLPNFEPIEGHEDTGSTAIVARGQLYKAGLSGYNPCGFARYNVETNRWDILASTSVEHTPCHMVELHGYIYAISGERQIYDDYFVERYNIEMNQWDHVSPLKPGGYIWNTAVVVFKEMILIASIDLEDETDEQDKDDKLIMQMYNPVSDTWHIVYSEKCDADAQYPRCEPYLTVHKSECYLVLVYRMVEPPRALKVYKLTCNIDGDLPTVCLGEEVPQKTEITKYFNTFAIDNDIYAIVDTRTYKLGNKATDGEGDLQGAFADLTTTRCTPVAYFTFDKRRYSNKHKKTD